MMTPTHPPQCLQTNRFLRSEESAHGIYSHKPANNIHCTTETPTMRILSFLGCHWFSSGHLKSARLYALLSILMFLHPASTPKCNRRHTLFDFWLSLENSSFERSCRLPFPDTWRTEQDCTRTPFRHCLSKYIGSFDISLEVGFSSTPWNFPKPVNITSIPCALSSCCLLPVDVSMPKSLKPRFKLCRTNIQADKNKIRLYGTLAADSFVWKLFIRGPKCLELKFSYFMRSLSYGSSAHIPTEAVSCDEWSENTTTLPTDRTNTTIRTRTGKLMKQGLDASLKSYQRHTPFKCPKGIPSSCAKDR